ncbi:MAG: type II toxin-antitoxin system VapC family toxin [Solirubrobacterales bacterium]
MYFDSSALLKRVLDEEHTKTLRGRIAELAGGPNELVTSTLAWVEVTRALKSWAERLGRNVADFDAKALAGIEAYPISYEIVALARKIGPQSLRSLDAIHCAAATIADAGLIVSYDARLLDAANMIGFATESPGAAT